MKEGAPRGALEEYLVKGQSQGSSWSLSESQTQRKLGWSLSKKCTGKHVENTDYGGPKTCSNFATFVEPRSTL